MILLANLRPSKYPAAAAGNDKPAGSPRRAPGLRQAAPLQPRARGRSEARAGPPPGSVSAGPAQACAAVNLAGSAFPNARAGREPLPVPDIRGPHPLGAPKNKARRRPVPGLPRSGVRRPGHHCPYDPHHASPPRRGISACPPPGGPRSLGTCVSVPCGGVWSSRGPFSGKARHRDAAGASPPPFPSRRNNGGPGCRGRVASPPSASRCARGLRPGPAAAPPGRAPSPWAAPAPLAPPARPAPALTLFGAAAAFPLSYPKPSRKSPPSRGACTGNCILAAPGLGGGSPGRGQGEGAAGLRRRLEPAAAASRPPACLSR